MTEITTARTSQTKRANSVKNTKKGVETTGSIASNYRPLFSIPMSNYDMFIPSNPFSLNIDFGYVGENGETLASSTFMQGWANAMAALTEGGYFGSDFGGFGGASSGSCGFSGGSCGSGGGFTSIG